MGAFAVLAVLLVAVQAVFLGKVPTVELDLDAPAADRWVESLQTVVGLHGWNHSFGPIFSLYNAQLFDNVSADQMQLLGDTVATFWPEQAAELKGLAAAFAALGQPQVTYEYLCGWVYFHELMHTELASSVDKRSGCTGILAVDPATDLVIHGRNLDNVPRELRNVTLHHRWMRNGQLAFESVSVYWLTTGVMTGIKANLTTLEENWRFESVSAESALAYVANGTLPQVFWFRHILSTMQTFAEVDSFVRSTPAAVGMYVIASGPGPRQGNIYSLSQGVNRNVVYSLRDAAAGNYLVQTNYDRWKPDDPTDARRTVAEENLRALNCTSELAVFSVLSTYPVQNPETAYTAMMQASSGRMSCFLRQPITLKPSGTY